MSLLTEGATNGAADTGATAAAAAANGVGSEGAASGAEASAAYLYDVPDEFKAHEGITKFVKDGKVDGAAVLKSYTHLESLNGRDKIVVPKTDEEWGPVYDKLGRPESADKYVVTRPEKLPEGMSYDEEGEKFLRQFAHANGFNQKQFAAAYQTYFDRQQGVVANYTKFQNEAKEKVENDLKREHGQAYDGFKGAAVAAVEQYADPDFKQWLDETGLGNDPRMVRIFGRIGKEMLGESKLKGGGNGGGGPMTPAEWDAKITSFRTEHNDALLNNQHGEHKSRTDELTEMYRRKHGGK